MLGLGQIAEMEGDVATATEMYTKVLAKDPQNSNAIFGMQRTRHRVERPARSASRPPPRTGRVPQHRSEPLI